MKGCCCGLACEVWRGHWYMAKFGAASQKRHAGWSNHFGFIERLQRHGGFLSEEEKQALGKSKLTTRGVSKKTGKVTYTGNKTHLKASQCFGCFVSELACWSGVESFELSG